MKKYDHRKIEPKWQKHWEENKLYQTDLDRAKKPFYNLMMFPYPSAEGLHVGNMYAFVHSDAYGRYMRLKGYDVFEPIGLDGFGIHSENYAIKIGEHIKEVSARTEKHFYEQLHMIGNAYDWNRTVETYKPNYYKWTQWLFLQMHKKGLAYRQSSPVNWCPSCKTVLSDEQVIAGKCERCDSETEKRNMEQWFWRITEYADKLLKNLDWIDWSEEVKTIQKNWIGKSEGAEVDFRLSISDLRIEETIKIFTTRPDTLFGATYFVLAPEHPLVKKYLDNIGNRAEVEAYIEAARKKSEIERMEIAKDKSGVELEGLKAVNPVNDEEIPVFIADYVMMGYGTGAIMAVPAHDERDWEFAKKYGLRIIEVVTGGDDVSIEAYTGEGYAVNSGLLDGLATEEAKKKMVKWLEEKGLGKKSVNFRLRDWCVSRQRYWGPPIPMVHCGRCGWVPVPEKDLPVELPEMDDFLPDGSGKGPLNKIDDFVNTACPGCGGPAKRETDVSDPFVDSSWYYLRYPGTERADRALDEERLGKWLPVDMYIGGKEHSVLHLLYSRFVTMVMHDLGYIKEAEPFRRFRAHGLLIRDGAKMSKSKGNVINPDEYIERYGADAVRLYLMFLGDMRQGGDWRDSGMQGMHRFVSRAYRLLEAAKDKEEEAVTRARHKAIKGVGGDLDKLKYNTAIAKLMALANLVQDRGASRQTLRTFALLISPFAPHLAEEMHRQLGGRGSVFLEPWPEYNPDLVQDESIELVIQVNGRLRDTLEAAPDIGEEEAKKLALQSERVRKWTSGKEVKKVVFVPGKLVNIVAE